MAASLHLPYRFADPRRGRNLGPGRTARLGTRCTWWPASVPSGAAVPNALLRSRIAERASAVRTELFGGLLGEAGIHDRAEVEPGGLHARRQEKGLLVLQAGHPQLAVGIDQ